MSPADRLHGLRVLITRPAGQADRLHGLVAAAGGRPVRLPAIEIHDTLDLQRLRQVLMQLLPWLRHVQVPGAAWNHCS